MTNEPLSELKEQAKVVSWAKEQDILISSINQSTFTTSWKALSQNQMAGTARGVPDLVMIIPAKYRKNQKSKTVFCEMKKEKGGYASPEQILWITALDESDGVCAKICRGHEQAIEFISSFMEIEPPPDTRTPKEIINTF